VKSIEKSKNIKGEIISHLWMAVTKLIAACLVKRTTSENDQKKEISRLREQIKRLYRQRIKDKEEAHRELQKLRATYTSWGSPMETRDDDYELPSVNTSG